MARSTAARVVQATTQHMAPYTRLFLILLSEVNLVLGALLYVYPDLGLNLWPWPVKPLALRFFGAIFLAIAFGCWAAIRARIWQRAKILLLVGATFFGIITLVLLADKANSNPPPSIIWPWIVFFSSCSIGCFSLLWKQSWFTISNEDSTAQRRHVPLSASIFFGLQTVIVGFFGIIMFVSPEVAQAQFWPWKVAVPTLRAFAGLFLATCIATGWAFLQREDIQRVRVLLPLDMIFPSLALLAVAIHWNIVSSESPGPLVTGVWIFVYSFVAVGSTILWLTTRQELA